MAFSTAFVEIVKVPHTLWMPLGGKKFKKKNCEHWVIQKLKNVVLGSLGIQNCG